MGVMGVSVAVGVTGVGVKVEVGVTGVAVAVKVGVGGLGVGVNVFVAGTGVFVFLMVFVGVEVSGVTFGTQSFAPVMIWVEPPIQLLSCSWGTVVL